LAGSASGAVCPAKSLVAIPECFPVGDLDLDDPFQRCNRFDPYPGCLCPGYEAAIASFTVSICLYFYRGHRLLLVAGQQPDQHHYTIPFSSRSFDLLALAAAAKPDSYWD
jgi:hypothetical protein